MFAEVIINSNVRSLNKIFDYIVPKKYENTIKVGARVSVPFGKGTKCEDGFVINLKENSEFVIDVDCVIMSIGTSPNPLIKSTTKGLDTQKWGGIIADEETGLTSRENVYAGGDAVTGAATVILAMGAGKAAAKAIDDSVNK